MDETGYGSDVPVSPRVRERKRAGVLQRKRRHSSLQMDRNSMSIQTSASDLEQPKRSSKIQIFKVFGVHLPLLLRKERALMGINETPRMSIMREETEEHHSIPRLVHITVEHLRSSEGRFKFHFSFTIMSLTSKQDTKHQEYFDSAASIQSYSKLKIK